MPSTLSIRSYSRQKVKHTHDFHQIVLPLRGVIEIEVGEFNGKVAPGECVVIKAQSLHHFTAKSEARFVVADMSILPANIDGSHSTAFAINGPLLHYLKFVEAQLEYQVNSDLEDICYQTFFALLSEQRPLKQVEHRIRAALEYIDKNIASPLSVPQLATIACLSPTQFKKLFKQQLELTPMQYLINQRMEKAQALLIHTDYPPQQVAEQVGYTDYTAFSRRFSLHFGLSPSKLLG
ncbi:helix-turn-helix domain-containing protein [Paraglaciecola sp. 2405UD69-4]|uniref:helix-turn-helix domain-containing protein n=1 Tax=Paraglaciecola sp. 2405UD69-4 TaxID=3391836 RepID=UPI0039C8C84C